MKQADLGLNLSRKRTRKREFLDEMNRVGPWAVLVALVIPLAPEGKRGRPPLLVETMLRIHFMQQWFTFSDPAMEEALHDVALLREFAGLDNWSTRLPDESTILRFRHLLEQHKLAAQMLVVINDMLATKGLMLRTGTVVDATLISAPSSTKNASGERDPAMHQTKKGNQWHFGMKAHIGADADSGLVHTVRGTSGNVNDVVNQSTYCPACSGLLIQRNWYELGEYHLKWNRCGHCGQLVAGVFETRPGNWGRLAAPVSHACRTGRFDRSRRRAP